MNRRQEELSRTRREDTLGRVFWDVFPAAKAPSSRFWDEYHRCASERVPVHFEEHYAPLDTFSEVDAYPAPGGGLNVFFRDITARKRLEAEREQLYEAAKAGEEQFRTLADAIPVLAWYAEPDGKIPWHNRRWHEYTGLPIDEQDDWKWRSVHDPADVDRVTAKWMRSLATGEPFEDTFRLRRHDGALRWFLTRVEPLRDAQGRVVRWVGTNIDIDAQTRATEALRFVAEASAALASSLDPEATLASVARLAVPRLADFCAVDVRNDSGGLERLAVAHVDPAKAELGRELARLHPPDPSAPHGAGKVVRTGESELLEEITDAVLEASARSPEHLRVMRELGLRSSMAVPISAQGRTLGAITFVSAESGRRFDASDLSVAEDLARRAGVALDHARLFELTQQERRRAEEANRAKDEFLSVASHELRTPLTAILGWSRMLRAGALPEEKRARALEAIERNARVQAQLVEDILDVSRIITGKLRLDLAPVEPGRVVEAAVEVVRPAAEAKGVRLEVRLDPEPGLAHADAARLQQVVWNLLANAVKFTPRGGRVEVLLRRAGTHVEILVRDTGEGIDPAFLPYVFQPFRQADASATRAHGGLGLGLAIVKHLVELHGGTVEARSDGPGLGATFTARVPRGASPPAPGPSPNPRDELVPASGRALEPPQELEGLDILVVDDEPDARELLESILEACGAQARLASSAAEALSMLSARPPDVLVSDVGMAGESGLELIRKVRARPEAEGGRVPALALTAYASPKDRTRALVAGFTAHAAKPVDPQELVAAIAALLGRNARG